MEVKNKFWLPLVIFAGSMMLIFNIDDTPTQVNNIVGITEEELYNEETEFLSVENDDDFVIEISEWQEYLDQQYIPDIENMIITARQHKAPTKQQIEKHEVQPNMTLTEFENKMVQSLKDVELHPSYGKVLDMLNPSRADTSQVYSYGWSTGYGVTQINMKLIPLATLSYPDFERNYSSQFKFLNDYIKAKSSRGLSNRQIVESYKYCIKH